MVDGCARDASAWWSATCVNEDWWRGDGLAVVQAAIFLKGACWCYPHPVHRYKWMHRRFRSWRGTHKGDGCALGPCRVRLSVVNRRRGDCSCGSQFVGASVQVPALDMMRGVRYRRLADSANLCLGQQHTASDPVGTSGMALVMGVVLTSWHRLSFRQ